MRTKLLITANQFNISDSQITSIVREFEFYKFYKSAKLREFYKFKKKLKNFIIAIFIQHHTQSHTMIITPKF